MPRDADAPCELPDCADAREALVRVTEELDESKQLEAAYEKRFVRGGAARCRRRCSVRRGRH